MLNVANLGDQVLNDVNDTYYYSNDFELLYCRHKITKNNQIRLLTNCQTALVDVTDKYIDSIIDWNIVSSLILYKKNTNVNNKYKVLIFHDSMILSMLSIYLNMFYQVYTCKNRFDASIIELVNSDYIFEFRIERFL